MNIMPIQKPGKSKQDYGTPDNFMAAVVKRFGPMSVDLAASHDNAQAPHFFTEAQDSLRQDWRYASDAFGENLWLNPPYADITPWAKKCSETVLHSNKSRILLLVPASIGSEWFGTYVEPYAFILAIRGRLTFRGCTTPYPKDCILAVYGCGYTGFEVWDWRKQQ